MCGLVARSTVGIVFAKAFAAKPLIVSFRHTISVTLCFFGSGAAKFVCFLHGGPSGLWLPQSGAQFLDKTARTGGGISGILEASNQSGSHDRRIGMLGHGFHLAG